jgi:hypothetical protein
MALRLRRGTNAERLTITPEIGELIYTTDTKKVFVGDGTTAGGIAIDTGLLDLAGNNLSDLGDVATTAPTDTQVLAWNDTNSYWEPQDAATPDLSASGISDLSDVAISVINTGQILVWDGTNFIPGDANGDVVSDTSPVLGGDLDGAGFNITNAGTISAVNMNGTNFTGNFIGTHSGDFNGDFDGTFIGSIYNEDSAITFDAENNTLSNLVSVTATDFAGNLTGNVTGDVTGNLTGDLIGNVQGSVFADDSTPLVDGIGGNVFGTIKGELETENVVNTMYATGQNSILKMYKHGGSLTAPTEPSNFARVGISLGSYNTSAANFIDEAIMFSYHQTAGGGYLALSPVAQDNFTFFETALELDGNAEKMIVAAPNGATFSGPITPGVYADAAARDAAITAPTAGMMVFVTDVAKFQGYDGTSWANLN